ncbi:MAG: type II CRISPR RNA-guided endonuclease Cas9 [Gammaproteobacteria bacterium]
MVKSKSAVLPYTLGLDIGIASVGAALLGEERILGLHVRTFDRAETSKEGESLNKIRRESRLTRRRIRRRAHRLLRLRRLFHHYGLISSASSTSTFTDTVSPWQLRAEGLDRLLKSEEWAATLYHLVKHRGFQSNRKSEAKVDEKVGQMLSGVNSNRQLLEESGLRTMGELASRHQAFTEAKRNKGGSYSHTFSRSDLEIELRVLFAQQRKLGNQFATKDLEEGVHTLLMARRPALSGLDLLKMVGNCTFEPDEFRAPKASYSAERFVWLTKLNNLRISSIGETRALSEEERHLILPMPFTRAKVTYKQVRTALKLPEHMQFVGLRYPSRSDSGKDPETATFFEAKGFQVLRKAYNSVGLELEWQRDSQNPERLDELAYALTVFKEDDEARVWLAKKGIEEDIVEAVLNYTFSDFVRLSTTALLKILPHMEAGRRYDEAVRLAGYSHHSLLPRSDRTLYIPRFGKQTITNPVVARALNQARKLVNAIVREYGPPGSVHIELARDLSRPLDERRKIQKEQEDYQKAKVGDIDTFEENFGFIPKGVHLAKWRLYREQAGKCAYSLTPLDLNRLFEDGYAEIDHALPYSRSFNNGMNNKVLVHTAENRNKGNRTPYEYLGGENESEQWHAFVSWVNGTKGIRQQKRRNLLRRDFGAEAASEFRERHLNDTRYIAREFKRMVETHLMLADESGKQGCVVVSGQLTGYLRARWGLLKVREEGDKHHALDAAVVAACSHGMVKRLSDYARKGELKHARSHHVDPETGEVIDIAALRTLDKHFPQPWHHFRDEVIALLAPDPVPLLARLPAYSEEIIKGIRPIRVSRAPTRRGLGAAHQETIRSAKYLEQGKSTVKTPLDKLKLKDLPNIVGYDDPRNRQLIEAIEERLQEHGDNGEKAFKEPLYKPGKNGKTTPRVRSVKLFSVQKSGMKVRGGIANNGDMVRVDIFTDGKKYSAVPIYVADTVKAELPNRAVVAYKSEDEWTLIDEKHQFMFSLYPNDWVSVATKPNALPQEGYFAGLDRATGAISIWSHDRNQSVGKNGLIRGIGIKTAQNLEKYHVDMLGNLHRVQREDRQQMIPKA